MQGELAPAASKFRKIGEIIKMSPLFFVEFSAPSDFRAQSFAPNRQILFFLDKIPPKSYNDCTHIRQTMRFFI